MIARYIERYTPETADLSEEDGPLSADGVTSRSTFCPENFLTQFSSAEQFFRARGRGSSPLTAELSTFTARFFKSVLPSLRRIKSGLMEIKAACSPPLLLRLFPLPQLPPSFPPSSLSPSPHPNSSSSYYYLKYCSC